MVYPQIFETQKTQKLGLNKPLFRAQKPLSWCLAFGLSFAFFVSGLPGFASTAKAAETGSIRVCKMLLDQNGSVIDGAVYPGTIFTIPGITPSPATSVGAPVGELTDTVFTTPFILDADLVSVNGIDDGTCAAHEDLELGGYYYGQESISASGWVLPKYNDQFSLPVASLGDFFIYDDKLFDADPGNDPARNLNVDGHIVLTAERPERTLIVLNQIAPTTLTIMKQVINDDVGTSTPADFSIHVKQAGVDVAGSPAPGSGAGTQYALNSGTYTVSEDPAPSYSVSFSGDCDASGNVVLNFGENKTCTIINDDLAAGERGGSGGGEEPSTPPAPPSGGGGGGGSSGGSSYSAGLGFQAVAEKTVSQNAQEAVTITNTGLISISAGELKITFPNTLSMIQSNPSASSLTSNMATWNVPTLLPSGTFTVQFTVIGNQNASAIVSTAQYIVGTQIIAQSSAVENVGAVLGAGTGDAGTGPQDAGGSGATPEIAGAALPRTGTSIDLILGLLGLVVVIAHSPRKSGIIAS